MRCKKIERRLERYLGGELKQQQVNQVKQHLNQCNKCRQEVDLLAQTSAVLRTWEGIEPSDDFEARFWQRIALEERQLLTPGSLGQLARIFSPVAIIAALIIGGLALSNFVKKNFSSETINLAEKRYLTSSALDSFQNIPPGSLTEVYIKLVSGAIKANP
ncbi:MAG: anti-sigma factor family protein [bacterium]